MYFRSLEYVENLVKVGVPREQATVQARAFEDVLEKDLATKKDILMLKQDILSQEEKMSQKMLSLEQRMTIKFEPMMAVGIGIIVALIKF